MSRRPLEPATLLARALGWIDPTTRSLAPPLYPSAAYLRAPDGSYPGGHTYGRDQNPTFDQAEAVLARLDGGAQALLFASGMAAAATVFETVQTGAHVLLPDRMYWTIRGWVARLADRGRFSLSFYDNRTPEDLRAKMRPETELVWVETPSNPLGEITDLEQICAIARAGGATVVADGTTATPLGCRPLDFGADLVVHSATKQLSGHSDVIAGVVTTARVDERWETIRYERGYRGAILGPFEAWLLLRGMRTLALRVRQSSQSAQRLAEFLEADPRVEEVFYPGLSSHPDHDLARRQMNGVFGMLVSFRPRGGEAAARALLSRLQLFHDATSLGGVESLVEHRARIEGPASRVPPDLLRLSIGIEETSDLIEDLKQALDAV